MLNKCQLQLIKSKNERPAALDFLGGGCVQGGCRDGKFSFKESVRRRSTELIF